MIVRFVAPSKDDPNTTAEVGRFEASKLPAVGNEVRLPTGAFTVKNIAYEYFGTNDYHAVEILLEAL